jgi:hypothetical protein
MPIDTTTDTNDSTIPAVDDAEKQRRRELKKAQNRRYREKYKDDPGFRERKNVAQRRYHATYKDRLNEQLRGKRDDPAYRERDRQTTQRWRSANRERCRQVTQKWSSANPDRLAAIRGWEGARRRGGATLHPDYASVSDMILATMPYYAEARRLTAETGQKHEVDHIESLAGGGLHHADNLQVVSRHWNRVKFARESEEILAAIFRGDDVPLTVEAVQLVYDAIEAVAIEASLAGITSPARTTLENLLKVLLRSDNSPCFSPVAVGQLLAELRASIAAATPAAA